MNYKFNPDDYEAIEFHDTLHDRIKICPMYYYLGFSPIKNIFGRAAVYYRLVKALALLPAEYGLLIWDVYRPRVVQAELFLWMREEIRKKLPELNEEEQYAETKKYMSAPSQIGDDYCPPHLSGGAIDLTLYSIETGYELDMGTPFDECSERAHSHYYERQKRLSEDNRFIKERRKLLREAMEHVGFTSYQYEWWHFDLGTIFWSNTLNCPSVFGPLFGDEEWPKHIQASLKGAI